MVNLLCERALLPGGWARDVVVSVDGSGCIASVSADHDDEVEAVPGAVLPGIPNVHSHAFQRAMAGLAERAAAGDDSFWTWRELMYRFLERLGPDEVEAIAAWLYVEMLKAGYTRVGEFHYLHHDPDGRPYADRCEMALRMVRAARAAGIGLVLLPVLYGYAGFGGRPPGPAQRRFVNSPDELIAMIGELRNRYGDGDVAVGLALHSLRAVSPQTLGTALDGYRGLDGDGPVHIHVAEQQAEVEECLAATGMRPVRWLLDHVPVDEHWCLVHATHIDDGECRDLAACGAVAGLCPTTEANLGDGLFPARDFLDRGGRIGVGSDSHVSVSPVEELRWLEYGQRLTLKRRNVLAGEAGGSTGARLLGAVLDGGAAALGAPVGRIAPGYRADLIALDTWSPSLAAVGDDRLVDAWLFSGNAAAVRDVWVAGRPLVEDCRHHDEGELGNRFRAVMRRIRSHL